MVIQQYYKVFITSIVILFSLLLVSGCKNESTIEAQGNLPRIVSFTANPVTVPAGGDSVKLSWIVNNANSLSISPGVGVVNPADSGSITIFVDAPTDFKLTASNADGEVTVSAQVNVAQPMTVNGFVNDIDDVPMSGVTVVIKGKSPVTTGAGGDFSISDVLPPYEISIIVGTVQTAVVYQGLTRSNPILYYPESTTQSKLAVIGGNVPPASGKYTLVFFVTSTEAWSTLADQTTGAYSINAKWKGAANSYIGQLQVLRWIPDSTGLPAQYDAYGLKNSITISNGGTFSNYNFNESNFTDPVEKNISGSIALPSSSYSISNKYLNMNFGDATVTITGENGLALTDNFNYVVPQISGVTFEVDAMAQALSSPNNRVTFYRKRDINGGTSGVIVNLKAAPRLNLPLYNETGIDTTTQFNWIKESIGGVYMVKITPAFSGASYYILTSGNSIKIPNLSTLGLGLPANTGYEWFVNQLFPFSSMNAVVTTNFISVFKGSVESGYATSEIFQFTSH
ncbi:MAG: hypothetical protein P8X47_01370 [Ignavibacteriaceae bacterium]